MNQPTFIVRVHPGLAHTLTDLKAAAYKSKAKRQLFKCVSRLAQDLLPHHAGTSQHYLSGSLRDVVFRVKQGRLRIFYTMSRERSLVILLDVAQRKDGDKHDAYEVLNRRIRAGDFDGSFALCGHARPAV